MLHIECRPSLSSPEVRPSDLQKMFVECAMTTITRTFGRLWISALPLVVFLAVSPTVANAQTRIGSASSVTPEASGSVAGTLSAGSGVHANETIKTGSSGKAGLQFNDQSSLSVGPSSQVIQTKVPAARLLRPRAAHSGSPPELRTGVKLKSRRPMAHLAPAVERTQ